MSGLTGNFSAGVSGNKVKRALRFKARTYCIMPTARPVLTREETGRYDLAWKDLCSVLNALSK